MHLEKFNCIFNECNEVFHRFQAETTKPILISEIQRSSIAAM